MSAQPCGCDPQENYVCFAHSLDIESVRVREVSPFQSPATPEFVAAYSKKFDAQQLAYGNVFERSLETYNAGYWQATAEQAQARINRCAEILATFYRAPISMSSLQPVLDLALELNPRLKETK